MSFVLYKGPRVVKGWPVSIAVAIDGGNVQSNKVALDLTLYPKVDYDAKVASLKNENSTDVDGEMLKQIVVGWSDVVDETGAPVTFSSESLADLIAMQSAREAIFTAYYDAVSGKAAEKN